MDNPVSVLAYSEIYAEERLPGITAPVSTVLFLLVERLFEHF
jgi:hypothetical protein